MKSLRTILAMASLFSLLAISSLAAPEGPNHRGPSVPSGLSPHNLRGMTPDHPDFHSLSPINGHAFPGNHGGYTGWHHYSGTLVHGPYYYNDYNWGWYPYYNGGYWGMWPAVATGALVGATAATCCLW